MTMVFYYLLSVWGATHILVSSKITEGIRNWFLIKSPRIGYMMECYQCSSFWISMIFYLLFNLDLNMCKFYIFEFPLDLSFIMMGFIGSGIVTFVSVILSLLITISKSRK